MIGARWPATLVWMLAAAASRQPAHGSPDVTFRMDALSRSRRMYRRARIGTPARSQPEPISRAGRFPATTSWRRSNDRSLLGDENPTGRLQSGLSEETVCKSQPHHPKSSWPEAPASEARWRSKRRAAAQRLRRTTHRLGVLRLGPSGRLSMMAAGCQTASKQCRALLRSWFRSPR